jgi:DNA polymerase-3 subunit beta
MKFTANASELQKALNKLGGVIPAKSPTPILEDFLLDLSGDTLTITATDLEVYLTTSIDVKGGTDGRIAIPGKRFIDTIRALPEDSDPTLVADIATNKVRITTKNGEYTLIGESAKEFPSIPGFSGSEEVSMDAAELRKIIQHTIFAVSTDDLRPAMMGVLFQSKGPELRAVSTDGHRLVRYSKTLSGRGALARDIIIPSKALQILARSMEGGMSSISVSDTHIRFQFERTTLLSRLIDETYPSYESVIPSDNEKVLTVSREEMVSSIRRVALYSSATTHQIRLTLKPGNLTITAQDIDFGGEARETISCEYTGDEIEIGFNAQYVVEMLNHLEAEKVTFRFGSPTRAGLLTPIATNGAEVMMLVMPVRLTG